MDIPIAIKLLDTFRKVVFGGASHTEAVAKAKVIGEAKGTIEAIELFRQAGYLHPAQQVMQQATIVDIVSHAAPLLSSKADPGALNPDWLINFYDKSRLTADEDMKVLWARILAGEVNVPTSFSKRTVNLVAQLEKSDAEDFSKVAPFVLEGKEPMLFIKNWNDAIFRDAGITHGLLLKLQDAGLLNSESWGGYGVNETGRSVDFHYFGKTLRIRKTDSNSDHFVPSVFFLTTSGKQLYPVSRPTENTDFLEYLVMAYRKDSQRGWIALLPRPDGSFVGG